jgi:hypothetical protein
MVEMAKAGIKVILVMSEIGQVVVILVARMTPEGGDQAGKKMAGP